MPSSSVQLPVPSAMAAASDAGVRSRCTLSRIATARCTVRSHLQNSIAERSTQRTAASRRRRCSTSADAVAAEGADDDGPAAESSASGERAVGGSTPSAATLGRESEPARVAPRCITSTARHALQTSRAALSAAPCAPARGSSPR